jgi:hypothetical protein
MITKPKRVQRSWEDEDDDSQDFKALSNKGLSTKDFQDNFEDLEED